VVGLAAPLILLESLPLAAVGLVAGALVPLTFWSIRRWRRMRRMRKEVPETLQMVADAAHAGHTLEQTIRQVAREIRGELSTEFAYCARQLDLGHAPVAALSRMARRVPVPEFRIFATAALVHRRTGGNLALLTDRLAAAARDRQQLQGHLNAVTAGSRLSALGLVMGTLVAAGILAWIEPDYLGVFFTSQFGPMLLTTAIGLQLLGAIWVWRILQVRY